MIKKSKTFTNEAIIKELDEALKTIEQKYNIVFSAELEMGIDGIYPILKYYDN